MDGIPGATNGLSNILFRGGGIALVLQKDGLLGGCQAPEFVDVLKAAKEGVVAWICHGDIMKITWAYRPLQNDLEAATA